MKVYYYSFTATDANGYDATGSGVVGFSSLSTVVERQFSLVDKLRADGFTDPVITSLSYAGDVIPPLHIDNEDQSYDSY